MGTPTMKMIEYAESIADVLDIEEPNYNDYDDVANFIAVNKNKYKRERQKFYIREEEEWNLLICL